MKRIPLILGTLAMCAVGALAQSDQTMIDNATAAAPRQLREGITVVKWKPDFTYDTIKKGTNRMVCYDLSGEPGRAPFYVECTSIANLARVAQNRKYEAITDKAARQAAFDKAEADGTRVKPEFGSVWIHYSGPDKDHARQHTTTAVPGATAASMGLPDNPKAGGTWIMNAGTSTAHIMTPGS